MPPWEGQFLHRVNLLSSCCWPGGMLVPWLPKDGGGDPSTALPPVNIAPVLITCLFQESGACYLLRLCRALLGASAFYTTLRFLFPPLCKVLWHSSFYLSSPKCVSKVSWHPVLWCSLSCSLCLCQVIYIPLRINMCVQLVMVNFLENFKSSLFSEIAGLLLWEELFCFDYITDLISESVHQRQK